MQFEYEIPEQEFVAAQLLFYKVNNSVKPVYRAAPWFFAGVFFIVVSWNEQRLSWSTVLLTGIGLWWIYSAAVLVFPTWHFRRGYRSSGLAGKKFRAEVREDGFIVNEEFLTWDVRWPGVSLKAEDKHGFMLYCQPTVFIFGKRYLTPAQQEELRRLAGLSASEH